MRLILASRTEFQKMSSEKMEIQKMLEEAGESIVIKDMVTKLPYKPIQTLAERYEYIKVSQEEGNFEVFEKIANLLAENFKYGVKDMADDYECSVYYGNDAYDFEFILFLARFYQNNIEVFGGHFDIISRMCKNSQQYARDNWDTIKMFWLGHTINK